MSVTLSFSLDMKNNLITYNNAMQIWKIDISGLKIAVRSGTLFSVLKWKLTRNLKYLQMFPISMKSSWTIETDSLRFGA